MSTTREPIQVAVDGPAGAGKSTVARRLAGRLGFTYIDTGAMYRAVALLASRRSISWEDEAGLSRLTRDLRLEFARDEGELRLHVDGEDVSSAIRTPEMSRGASRVSRWPGVRQALVAAQREMARHSDVVMEGRDIGTVVFPQAQVKIYLSASPEERARRRTEELRTRGTDPDPDEVLREVEERDRSDMSREHSPLRRADDAVDFCTDGLSIDEVVDALEELVRERAGR